MCAEHFQDLLIEIHKILKLRERIKAEQSVHKIPLAAGKDFIFVI